MWSGGGGLECNPPFTVETYFHLEQFSYKQPFLGTCILFIVREACTSYLQCTVFFLFQMNKFISSHGNCVNNFFFFQYPLLNKATVDNDTPIPGYLFEEIISILLLLAQLVMDVKSNMTGVV